MSLPACLQAPPPPPPLPCSTLKNSSGKVETKRKTSPGILPSEPPENVTELADHGYISGPEEGSRNNTISPPLDFVFANKKICFFVNKKGVSVLRVERHSAVEEQRLVDQPADGGHSEAPVLDLLQLVPLAHLRRLRGQLQRVEPEVSRLVAVLVHVVHRHLALKKDKKRRRQNVEPNSNIKKEKVKGGQQREFRCSVIGTNQGYTTHCLNRAVKGGEADTQPSRQAFVQGKDAQRLTGVEPTTTHAIHEPTLASCPGTDRRNVGNSPAQEARGTRVIPPATTSLPLR